MTSPEPGLRRVLGVWDAAALVVGIIIGSGIFATPPLVAGHLPSTGGMLVIWLLGGVLAFSGALCYAELSAMFPYTGGSYAFLREGYGRFPAFSYGWCALLITYPASIAGVALVFTAYLARLVPLSDPARPWVAAAVCLVMGVLNMVGVRFGALVLRSFTATKVLALGAIIIAVPLLGKGSWSNLEPAGIVPPGGLNATALALALAAIIWTYSGWDDGAHLSGEVRNPKRDVVRALFLGTLGVTTIYVLINLSYLFVLGVSGVQNTDSVAVDIAERLFGTGGNLFVTLLVLVSTLGSIMGMIIGASRIFYAMGRDKLSFEAAGRVHRRGSPAVALAAVSTIAAVYTLVGSFEQIIGYFVFVSTIFLALNVISVIRQRIINPDSDRPFRIPLYPVPPLVFLIVALGLMYQLFRENTRDSLIGIAIVLASVPAFLAWERYRKARESG